MPTGTIRAHKPKKTILKITWRKIYTYSNVYHLANTIWKQVKREKPSNILSFFHWIILNKPLIKQKKKEKKAIRFGLPIRPITRMCFGSINASQSSLRPFQPKSNMERTSTLAKGSTDNSPRVMRSILRI